VGKQIIEYDEPGIEGHREIFLSGKMILENISRKNHNYLAFQKDMAGQADCIRIAFALTGYSFITVYIETALSYLDRFAEDYSLDRWTQNQGGVMAVHPFSDFYLPEADGGLWNFGPFMAN